MIHHTHLTQYPLALRQFNKYLIHNPLLGEYGYDMIIRLRDPVTNATFNVMETPIHAEIHDDQERLTDD